MISEVSILLHDNPAREGPGPRLVAYADLVIADAFRVCRVKIVRTTTGRILVCMPDRKVGARCVCCTGRVEPRDCYCRHCGSAVDVQWPEDIHRDVVFPINVQARAELERAVLRAFVNYRPPTVPEPPIEAGPAGAWVGRVRELAGAGVGG